MNEHVIQSRRRQSSPGALAFRTERKLMLPIRREIGELQRRAAFAEARARSTRIDADSVITEIEDIKRAVTTVRDRVEDLMQEEPGVGPGEDCRKALVHLSQRLASVPN